jgi:hypothetical protein
VACNPGEAEERGAVHEDELRPGGDPAHRTAQISMLGPDLGGRQKVRPLAQRIASCSTRTTCEPRQRIKAPQQFEGDGEHRFRSTRDRSLMAALRLR